LIPNLVNTGSGGWSASLNWGNGLGPATNPQKNGFVAAGSTDSINDADIEDAAGTFHIMDGMAGLVSGVCSPNNGDMRAIFTDTRTDVTNTVGNVRPAMRHLDGYNVLFGDGHVKWKQYRTSKYENWTVQKD
jgi:prepilin-type processing-associated H-X9-DG protein